VLVAAFVLVCEIQIGDWASCNVFVQNLARKFIQRFHDPFRCTQVTPSTSGYRHDLKHPCVLLEDFAGKIDGRQVLVKLRERGMACRASAI
jgi:hypothetical protein